MILEPVFKLEIIPQKELAGITCTGLPSQLRDLTISQVSDRPRYSEPSPKLLKTGFFKNYICKTPEKGKIGYRHLCTYYPKGVYHIKS